MKGLRKVRTYFLTHNSRREYQGSALYNANGYKLRQK